MKRFLVSVLALILATGSFALAQQADDPASKEEVQQLFEFMHARQQTQRLMESMTQQFPAMMKATFEKLLPNATPEQRKAEDEFLRNMMLDVSKNLPYDDLLGAMVPAYQHHLTHGDIQQLKDFYSTPVAQKLQAEMPAMMAEYMQNATPIIVKWQTERIGELKKKAEEFAHSLTQQEKAKKPSKS